MNTEAVGAYSPTTIYGQLTSPFVPKSITINAHTSFDNMDDAEGVTFSKEDFQGKPQAWMKISIDTDLEEFGLSDNYKTVANSDNQNNSGQVVVSSNKVSGFSKSNLSSKDIVNSSLKKGYSTSEAIVISKAQQAYSRGIMTTSNATEALSSCEYKVF